MHKTYNNYNSWQFFIHTYYRGMVKKEIYLTFESEIHLICIRIITHITRLIADLIETRLAGLHVIQLFKNIKSLLYVDTIMYS